MEKARKICVVGVGSIRNGISGGFIYTHDVYLALCQAYANDSKTEVLLWQLETWHELFCSSENESHQHGQDVQENMDDGDGQMYRVMMSQSILGDAYSALPPGSVVVFDGFALLQSVNACLSDTIRDDLLHVAFVQYPFSAEPDASEADRNLCRSQERYALERINLLVGASECSLRMFSEEYPVQMKRLLSKPSVIPPIARFKSEFQQRSLSSNEEKLATVELLAVSNYVPRKNLLLILRALKECQGKTIRKWRLSILGNNQESEYRTDVCAYVKAHSLPVRFLKELKDPKDVSATYLSSHIFVHASNIENYCMAASEAVCCGLVICSTDTGEIRNFASPGNKNNTCSAFFYEPGDHIALVDIFKSLLDISQTELFERSRARAQEYAQEICNTAQHDDLFNSFDTFAKKWESCIENIDRDNNLVTVVTNKPDADSVWFSHVFYMCLSMLAMLASLTMPRIVAARIWVLFGITSFIDMYIFRRSGLLRLSPYIVHHVARLVLYVMLLQYPESDAGWRAAVNFNIYNLFLSISVLNFGLGSARWWWWRHIDLVLYVSFIPQRVQMYLNAPQFQKHCRNDGALMYGHLMTAIEVGNALNKLAFWWGRGR
jgi:glycosyltransferase involved in cell wall biosynthesis